MSNLQLSLVLIGIAVVIGVYLFNRLQERRYRRQAERVFDRPHGDPLLEEPAPAAEARIEPSLRAEPDATAPGTTIPGTKISGTKISAPRGAADPDGPLISRAQHARNEPHAPAAAASPTAAPSEPPPPPLDPELHYLVDITATRPIPAQALVVSSQRTRDIGKAVTWMVYDVGAGRWHPLSAGDDREYFRAVAALQLADRRGPVSDAQLSLFCDAVEEMAAEHLAAVDCPDAGAALAAAAELDRFCADVDVLIGLNVVRTGSEPVPAEAVRALAQAEGMELLPDGVFHARDGRGATFYTLQNREASPFLPGELANLSTRSLTLLLDVPRTKDGAGVFNRMAAFAEKLARRLDGVVVDDNGRPLSEPGLNRLRDQLRELVDRMDARGIPPGGERAMKLFS